MEFGIDEGGTGCTEAAQNRVPGGTPLDGRQLPHLGVVEGLPPPGSGDVPDGRGVGADGGDPGAVDQSFSWRESPQREPPRAERA